MNWDQVQGQMKQLSGKLKQKWAKLTDDDLQAASGRRETFIGKLQERYGIAKEDAEKQLDEFLNSIDTKGRTA